MLKRLSDGAPRRRLTGSFPARILAAMVLMLIAYQSARTAITDLSRQELKAGIEQFQRPAGGDASSLLAATRVLEDYPFDGALAATRADVYSVVHYARIRDGKAVDSPSGSNPALSEYQQALRIQPLDGYLWARYGLYLSSLDPLTYRPEALTAMDRAIALSPRDYNTMRVVADIGVRHWHELDCSRRANLLALLDRAAAVDDKLLNQWITQLGQLPMGRYLERLYSNYGFNPHWARVSMAACRGEADG